MPIDLQIAEDAREAMRELTSGEDGAAEIFTGAVSPSSSNLFSSRDSWL